MVRTPKMQAAYDALLQSYADIQQRRLGQRFTAKRRAATIALAEMYDALRERLRDSGWYEPLTCECKIDRVILTTNTLSWKAIFGIPGYVPQDPYRLRRQNYRFAQRFRGTGSISEIVIEYARTASWFPHFRITIIPRDQTGLQYEDFRLLLEVLPSFKITVLEVAWDFPSGCVVDLDYVRRFGLFGSTWMQPGSNPFHDKWGNTGSKIVRAYFKWDTFQFRVELELHGQLLRRLGISDVFDFRKLVAALVPDHIDFSQLDEAKVAQALDRTGLPQHEVSAILKRVKQKAQTSLWSAKRYLREKAHLDNRHRLLVPVPEINRVIRVALETLVAQWPAGPARLGKKP